MVADIMNRIQHFFLCLTKFHSCSTGSKHKLGKDQKIPTCGDLAVDNGKIPTQPLAYSLSLSPEGLGEDGKNMNEKTCGFKRKQKNYSQINIAGKIDLKNLMY